MKKIITILGMMLIVCNVAYGVSVCAKSNTYVGILKKNITGTTGGSSNDGKIWYVDFDYGNNTTKRITGLAACNEVSGTYATPQTNLYTSSADAGEQCWCKMEPVYVENSNIYTRETGITSYWMFLETAADATTCASTCANDCMNAVKSNSVFRSAMYESVW